MREAFEQAVAEHKDLVFSYAFYYLGNRQEAEDVTQDVLVKLWQHWGELPTDAIAKWLNRVTRNASIDLLRKRTRQQRLVVDDGEGELVEAAPAADDGPHALAQANDFAQLLRAALAALPEPYKTPMILREIQELSYREIGESLDQPIGTIKTHVHRGRRMLRERLQKATRHDSASSAGLH